MRKTLIIIGVVLLIFVLGIWLYLSNLGGAVKTAIEHQGSQIMQVAVEVGKVNLSAKSGDGSIKNLIINNPVGFNTDDAFSFPETHFTVNTQSLKTTVVNIHQMSINAGDINIEQNAAGNNLHILQSNIQDFLKAQTENTQADKRFIIGSFTINNATLFVSAPLKQTEVITVALPDIQLNNIGQDKGGMTAAQAANFILQQVNYEIAKVLHERDLGHLIDLEALGLSPPSLTDKIRDFFENL